MQPRRPQPPAPRSRAPRPAARLLALQVLLALQGAATMPSGPGQPPDAGLSRGLLQQAARAALHFLNFRAGSPSALRLLAAVQQGRARVDSQRGCKVDLVFSTERYNQEEGEEHLGKCSANVFFKNQKPRPAINVTCTRLMDQKKRQQDDYLLYKQMKKLKNPLDAVSIPDSHGYIDPSLRPIWDLAFLGSSYVMWEKTSQFLHYYLVQLSSVKQWEIIPCLIHLVWYPGKPLKVKYRCEELQTSEEASGTAEGSAMELTQLSNF
ncbi:retinoic acid receptor responder protein 1 isoform X2 [Heterocephalus glaber]|uniref:Retinoic acid receptor responder protein 1 isoform X2 n=1 Tax=Heterocephalus glaber TaxID=10181 RepID=A0AAX6QWB9_HETGA|nr:retinoic acid receptor responder protein 1 isoform X2 [Heterocephalus glaber]